MRSRDVAINVQGTRAKYPCESCGRVVEWIDGRQSTHGPGPRGEMVCPGDRA